MGTTEPETREFIQVLLSCREKPFCITAVVLLKPFNQNKRASTYRGEDSHREEAMESPMVLVPAAAEARGTAGACLGAEAPARLQRLLTASLALLHTQSWSGTTIFAQNPLVGAFLPARAQDTAPRGWGCSRGGSAAEPAFRG